MKRKTSQSPLFIFTDKYLPVYFYPPRRLPPLLGADAPLLRGEDPEEPIDDLPEEVLGLDPILDLFVPIDGLEELLAGEYPLLPAGVLLDVPNLSLLFLEFLGAILLVFDVAVLSLIELEGVVPNRLADPCLSPLMAGELPLEAMALVFLGEVFTIERLFILAAFPSLILPALIPVALLSVLRVCISPLFPRFPSADLGLITFGVDT